MFALHCSTDLVKATRVAEADALHFTRCYRLIVVSLAYFLTVFIHCFTDITTAGPLTVVIPSREEGQCQQLLFVLIVVLLLSTNVVDENKTNI